MPGAMPDDARPGDDAVGRDAGAASGASPAAFHYGAGHVIMHGNQAFIDRYGRAAIGQPAREAMLDVPGAAFELMGRVLREGRALATTVQLPDGPRRLVVVPRRDPETDEIYGVTTHLRA
jgi:hypothetical protein